MRVAIPHDLPREEVRRRLKERSPEIASYVPGQVANVQTSWPNEDQMNLSVGAMGASIDGRVLVEEHQVVFEVDLPPMLAFVEPMVAGAIRENGQKLLTKS